jgi:23S rRNA (pseudouridine1915-N3)-methyltransferase
MRIRVIAVGKLKKGPERELEARYVARCQALGRTLGLVGPDVVEIAEGKARNAQARKRQESEAIGQASEDAVFVALDETGRMADSAGFATTIREARDSGARRLCFAIGGPDGLDPDCRAGASEVIAFGRMTLPHQLVRIVLAEQLYRAMTILSGHPYHRE